MRGYISVFRYAHGVGTVKSEISSQNCVAVEQQNGNLQNPSGTIL